MKKNLLLQKKKTKKTDNNDFKKTMVDLIACCSEDLIADVVSNYLEPLMQKLVMSGSYLSSVAHALKTKINN